MEACNFLGQSKLRGSSETSFWSISGLSTGQYVTTKELLLGKERNRDPHVHVAGNWTQVLQNFFLS
jgi:hypothetical protein